MPPSVFDLIAQHKSATVGPAEADRRLARKLPRRHRGVLRAAREAGTLPFTRVGMTFVYERGAFDAWIAGI